MDGGTESEAEVAKSEAAESDGRAVLKCHTGDRDAAPDVESSSVPWIRQYTFEIACSLLRQGAAMTVGRWAWGSRPSCYPLPYIVTQ